MWATKEIDYEVAANRVGVNGGLDAEAAAPVDCGAGDVGLGAVAESPVDQYVRLAVPVDLVAEVLPMDPVAGFFDLDVLVSLFAAEVRLVAGCADLVAVVLSTMDCLMVGFADLDAVVLPPVDWVTGNVALGFVFDHFLRKNNYCPFPVDIVRELRRRLLECVACV
ncbi:hypothetical protein JRO89_XS05G0095800 [Xanthoceras sorbifolium]|uniref:Uncharacterized protein n=1 Tax=Xanthoceras sorbifolium TaxID=99658 RepID=A0ABQ8I1A0_9ROSI|nr:hypothetical protein JRO89_XS05G0095800 [Xanthoceras sorbifolium]